MYNETIMSIVNNDLIAESLPQNYNAIVKETVIHILADDAPFGATN